MKDDLIERLLYLTLGLVFIGAGFGMGLQIQSNNRIADQNKILSKQNENLSAQVAALKVLGDNQSNITKDINHSLSCILIVFSTPGRTDYYISDLTTCTITNKNTGQSQRVELPTATNSGSSQQSRSSPPATGSTFNPQQGASSSGGSSGSAGATDDPAPMSTPVVTQVRDFTCDELGLLCR